MWNKKICDKTKTEIVTKLRKSNCDNTKTQLLLDINWELIKKCVAFFNEKNFKYDTLDSTDTHTNWMTTKINVFK